MSDIAAISSIAPPPAPLAQTAPAPAPQEAPAEVQAAAPAAEEEAAVVQPAQTPPPSTYTALADVSSSNIRGVSVSTSA